MVVAEDQLSDEQARRLKARAAQHGQKVEDYLLNLAAHDMKDVEWERLADELAQRVPETVPPLPDEALRREAMYREEPMAYLLDTNILLRFVHRTDPAHPTVRAAIRRLRAEDEPLHFAPQNAAEAWNVATRPEERNGYGFAVEQADHMLLLLERLFTLLPETPELYPAWRLRITPGCYC